MKACNHDLARHPLRRQGNQAPAPVPKNVIEAVQRPARQQFPFPGYRVDRAMGLDAAPPVFVRNEEHRFVTGEHIREIGAGHNGIIREPLPGTPPAPAMAPAALYAMASGKAPLLLVLPADHV